jgi:hypothetical protein
VLVGGFNHLEKYESQWEGLSHILWKIKNVWNHQPECEYRWIMLCIHRLYRLLEPENKNDGLETDRTLLNMTWHDVVAMFDYLN